MNFYRKVISRSFDNGLRVFVLPQPTDSVEVECFIKTGSIHEAEHLGRGLSHFLEHMLFQGCRNYPGTEAADTIDRLGGSINAYTSYDHTVFHANLAARHLETAIDVLASMVRSPDLPEARFAAERDVILREQELGMDQPERRLYERLNAELFRVHPVRHPIIGYRELIAGVTREMVQEYHRRRYTPDRTFWVVTGGIDPEDVFHRIGDRLGEWPVAYLAEPALPQEPKQCALRRAGFEFADPLARLALAIRIPGIAHRDLPALDILAGLIGMGDGGRLVRSLELKQKLAIHLRSFCYAQPFGGLLGIGCTAEPGKLARLERGVFEELEKLRDGQLDQREVEREKTQQFAEHLRQLRNLREVAANIGGGVIGNDSPDLSDIYLENLQTVTLDDVIRVAKDYLGENALTVVTQIPTGAGRPGKVRNNATALIPTETTLSRGVHLVTIPDRRLPLIDLAVALPGGTIYESAATGGISALAAGLLTAGTGKHSESELLCRLDACGADLSVNTGLNSWIIELNAPRNRFRNALKLVAEILNGAAFGEAEFERDRCNRIELLKSREQSPRAAAENEARRILFGPHPYSWGKFGTKEQLAHITREDVVEFYRSRWHAPQVIFGFGGDCTPEEAFDWAGVLAAAVEWRESPVTLPSPPEFPAGETRRTLELAREQTAVIRAMPGPALCDSGIDFFEILLQAANGLSSRLFKSVREENALAYTTGMQLSGGFHPGWLLFHATTTAEQAALADRLLRSEIERLATRGLSAEEFESAREGAAFAAAQNIESVDRALASAVLGLHYGRPLSELWSREERLRKLTITEVNTAIRPYLSNPAAVSVFAGRQPTEKQ